MENQFVNDNTGNPVRSQEKDLTANEHHLRHAQFVAALDQLPETILLNGPRMMRTLKKILKWNRHEIEAHAYLYFAALTEVDEEAYDAQSDHPQLREHAAKRPQSTWKPDEIRLLHTLLATYTTPVDDDVGRQIIGNNNSSGNDCVLSRLTRFFPHYTDLQIRNQVELMLQSSDMTGPSKT